MRITKTTAAAIAGALLLGGIVGAATANDTTTVEEGDETIAELRAQLEDARGSLAEARADAEEAEQRAADAKVRAERAARRKLASRKRSLDRRARKLDDREAAIRVAEDAYEAGTIPGDGRLRVGEDVQPGVYQAEAPASGNCYWARLASDSGGLEDIIANGNAAGPVTITIAPSDHMIELSGCEDFHKVG